MPRRRETGPTTLILKWLIGCLFGQRLLVLGVVYGSAIDENVQLLTSKPLGSGVDGLLIGIIQLDALHPGSLELSQCQDQKQQGCRLRAAPPHLSNRDIVFCLWAVCSKDFVAFL